MVNGIASSERDVSLMEFYRSDEAFCTGTMGELVGIGLATGARVSGPVALLVFATLLVKRIAVEERALRTSTR